jgi:TRAP-type C4-dicarboxylate transport system permease small subunit
MCVKDDTHPTVTIFVELFPKPIRKIVRIAANVCVFIVGIVMIIVGYRFALRYVEQLTPTLRISIAFVYAAIHVSGFFICFQSANNFIEGLSGKSNTAAGDLP